MLRRFTAASNHLSTAIKPLLKRYQTIRLTYPLTNTTTVAISYWGCCHQLLGWPTPTLYFPLVFTVFQLLTTWSTKKTKPFYAKRFLGNLFYTSGFQHFFGNPKEMFRMRNAFRVDVYLNREPLITALQQAKNTTTKGYKQAFNERLKKTNRSRSTGSGKQTALVYKAGITKYSLQTLIVWQSQIIAWSNRS